MAGDFEEALLQPMPIPAATSKTANTADEPTCVVFAFGIFNGDEMPESNPVQPRSPKPQEVVGSEGGTAPMLPPRDSDGDERTSQVHYPFSTEVAPASCFACRKHCQPSTREIQPVDVISKESAVGLLSLTCICWRLGQENSRPHWEVLIEYRVKGQMDDVRICDLTHDPLRARIVPDEQEP